MLFTEKRTETEWEMTSEQVKELAKELLYIAEEANDHRCCRIPSPVPATHPSQEVLPHQALRVPVQFEATQVDSSLQGTSCRDRARELCHRGGREIFRDLGRNSLARHRQGYYPVPALSQGAHVQHARAFS